MQIDKGEVLRGVVVTTIAILLVAGGAFAATTISSNLATNGDLSVDGVVTLGNGSSAASVDATGWTVTSAGDATFTSLTGPLTGNVTGNVTGDLTGNVTGNLTGNVTGNLTGNVTGDVTGDLTGNVTGNVSGSSGSTTGNAATATALQTARTINGVSFDGTANITVPAAAGTLTGTTLASGVTDSSLTSLGTLDVLVVSSSPGAVNFGRATVAQLTNVNTDVFVNGVSATITTQTATTAANTAETGFTVGDFSVSASSVIIATVTDYTGTWGTNGIPGVIVDSVASGSFHIRITNSGTTALNGSMKINFVAL